MRGRGAACGFTLLEVVVALTILAAGLVAVSQLFSGALRLSGGARDASESAIYARQRMEEALLAPDPVEGMENGSFGEKYRWQLRTTFLPPEDGQPQYQEIRFLVKIRWVDGSEERFFDLGASRWLRKEESRDGA